MHLKSQAAFLICHLASVLCLSVPPSQQITQRNGIPLNVSSTTSSNLTVPPPIPSFYVRITHDHNPVVNALGMFSAAIQLMSVLALKNWNGHTNGYIVHGPRYYPATLELQAWPDPSSGLLLVKHAVVGLYEAGNSLARSPAVADPFLTRLFGGLFLHNQQIGYIKCLPCSASLEDEVNSTLSIVNAVNSTVALELRPNDGPQAELTDDSGSFVDPIYGSFTYTYQLKDRTVDLRDIFSVFLDAMATAAPQHIDQPGAVINVASESGNLALNLHGSPSLSALPWLCVSRLLGLIWIPVIVKAHNVKVDNQEICIDSHIYNDYYDEYEMHYRLEGSADESSPVLLFSNGINNDLRIWDAAIARFKLQFPNYRFLRYDTRGYRFEGCGKPLNLTIVTHDIVVLLDALQISKAHAVLGASLGGTTAITFAIQYPDRLSKGFVASGIYIDASLANSTTEDTRITCAKMCGMPAIAPVLIPGWFTSNATNGPVWNEALRMVGNASADGMGVTRPLSNEFYDTVNPKDLQHRGFYIVGKEDYKTQGFMKEFVANNTPNEGLHEVGGSHLCMWENPDGWVDVVKDFLSESA